MPDDYVDIDPGAVSTAGRTTAATSTQWSEWAGKAENLLRAVAADVREAQLTAAFETHLSIWNPRMKGIATSAEGLGTNAVSASTVVVNADTTANLDLTNQGDTVRRLGSNLRRPIAV